MTKALPFRPRPRDPRPLRRIRDSVRTGLVWGVAAVAVNVVWLGAARAFGVPTTVYPLPGGESVEIGPLNLIAATLAAALLAGLLVGILGRVVRKPLRYLVAGGLLLTVASLRAPLDQPEAITSSTRVVLASCQIITGLLITFGLARGLAVDDQHAM